MATFELSGQRLEHTYFPFRIKHALTSKMPKVLSTWCMVSSWGLLVKCVEIMNFNFQETSSKGWTHNLKCLNVSQEELRPWLTCNTFKSVIVSSFIIVLISMMSIHFCWRALEQDTDQTLTSLQRWKQWQKKRMFFYQRSKHYLGHYQDNLISSFRMVCSTVWTGQGLIQFFWFLNQKPQHHCLFSVTECSSRTVRRMLCHLYVVRGEKCVERQRFLYTTH